MTIKARLSATTRSVYTHRASYRKRERPSVRCLPLSTPAAARFARSPSTVLVPLPAGTRFTVYRLCGWIDAAGRVYGTPRFVALPAVHSHATPFQSFSPLFYGFTPLLRRRPWSTPARGRFADRPEETLLPSFIAAFSISMDIQCFAFLFINMKERSASDD